MKRKISLGGIFASIFKCIGLLLVWIVAQSLVTSIVATAMQMSDMSLSAEKLSEVVMAKQTEILLISNALTILIFAFYYSRKRTTLFERAGFGPISFRNGLSSAILGVAFQYGVLLILSLIPLPERWYEILEETNSSVVDAPRAITVLAVGIMAPILEELLFRGLMIPVLNKNMHPWVSIVLSAAVFGAMHANPIGIIYATALGIMLGWLFVRLKSIIPCIVFHMAFNITSLTMGEEVSVIVAVLSIPIIILEIMDIIRTTGGNKK